ncbi:hypothetical protein FQZ97_1270330 [compost metagenome]
MATEREIALDQALVAVLGAAQDLGFNLTELTQKANILVIDHSKYRRVEHPHVTNACNAIASALEEVKSKA